jgi:aminomethyltransferase
MALLALQGPAAERILSRLTDLPLETIGYYRFGKGEVNGATAIVSRTGYTGEDGFELFVANDDAAPLWRAILQAGAAEGAIPAGLGSRDSLRLEMGYALYGNDLDETRTPFEEGLAWVTKLNKGDFTAFEALRDVKMKGVSEKLVGFRLLERGFPRAGYEIARNGEIVGRVTSGTLSPSLGVGIGMGYVAAGAAAIGSRLDVIIRGQAVPAEIVKPPFYTEGSIRR